MGQTRLYFYDTPLNKYSVTALLGALESRPGLPESLDVGFFCKSEELLAKAECFDDGDTLILAFSFFTSQLWEMHQLLTELSPLRQRLTVHTIGGGPHVSGDAERTVTVLGFDWALAGEGEETFPALAEALRDGKNLAGQPGITGRDAQGVLRLGGMAHRVDLERFEPDARRFRRYGPLEITRGCPYGCRFCQTGDLMGRGVRHRSIAAIEETIRRADSEFKVRFFRALTPNALSYGSQGGVIPDLGAVEGLLSMLRRILPDGKIYMGYFPSEVRPNNVTDESAALLRRFVDNDDIVIGAQTGSDAMLKHAHRGHNVEQVTKAVETLHRHGFIANVDFICGMPGETREDIRLSIAFMEKLADMGAKVNVHSFMPLPQTPWAGEPGGKVDSETAALIRKLTPKGVVYGDWVRQAQMASEIERYMKTGCL